jgi:tetratricopeptide (TPR) repeat protein
MGPDFYCQVETEMITAINKFFQQGLLQACALCAGFSIAGSAMAAEDVTARSLKLYEKHRYEDAARLLHPELAAMDGGRQASASLALGMIYLNSAVLHRELQQTALTIELDYLTQLSKQKSATPSRLVNYYLGQVLLETGKPAEAATYLRRFADQGGAPPVLKSFAAIELGIAYSRQKQAQKANEVWAGLDTKNAEIKAALAGAYAVAGAQARKPVAMADASLQDAKLQGHAVSPRMTRNLLRAYSHAGAHEKALGLLNSSELKGASSVEDIGSSKSISFYDVSILGDMAQTHLNAAVMYLEQASRDAKLSSTANYYLADAYLQQGKAELSLQAAGGFLSQAKIPPQYRDTTRIHQAVAYSLTGQKAEAGAIWQSLTDKAAEDPVVLAGLMQSCVQVRADCIKLEKLAVAAVEKGEGKKFFPLNAALGKYYLLQKDYANAVLYMEAGRDKANKNKIEINDPVLLVGLAEAYYRSKKFSENLEIYFEIAKQYPVVRQIQEAMQGIYSMEQQSAGDVKIF